uniref:Holliday junction resolvase n=1 Tax=Micrococcus phage Olihed TaxID=3092209 RepID=A0AAU6R580_9CAUD
MVMRNGKPALASDFGVKPPSHTAAMRRWRFLAIDPGDEHVGLAEFECGPDKVWYCVWAGEKTPEEFLPWYVTGLRGDRWEWVVVESWHLFPESSKFYVGSDMPTSRLIGSIEALAAYIPEDGAWFDEPVAVTRQDPQIKIPTRSVLKRRKLRSIARVLKVSGDHASDAELHGFKYMVDHKLTFENVTQQERRLAATHPQLSHSHALW